MLRCRETKENLFQTHIMYFRMRHMSWQKSKRKEGISTPCSLTDERRFEAMNWLYGFLSCPEMAEDKLVQRCYGLSSENNASLARCGTIMMTMMLVTVVGMGGGLDTTKLIQTSMASTKTKTMMARALSAQCLFVSGKRRNQHSLVLVYTRSSQVN